MFKSAIPIILGGFCFLVIAFIFRFLSLGRQSRNQVPELGLFNGSLRDCGTKPNCASTYHPNEKFRLPDIGFNPGQIGQLKKHAIEAMKEIGSVLVLENKNYLHFTNTSKLWGFVDDIEIYFNENRKKIELRSQSRVGHSDLGVNLERLKHFSRVFLEKLKTR